MNNNKIKFSIGICAMVIGALACQKVMKGYLSDDIYYLSNPMTVPQGVVTVSESLVANGSTAPLSVSLLGITNMQTGKRVDSLFLSPKALQVYKSAVTYADSTLAALRSKIGDSLVAPFGVSPIGGRMQFTGTTLYIPQGSYSMDLSVSNIRGARVFKNICEIDIVPTRFFIQTGAAYGYLLDTITQGRSNISPVLDATRNESGDAKIIIKWEDADGNVFNPKAGEVTSRNGLPSFQSWDPYYKVELTDTAFVYQYPDKVPVFPVFNPALVNGTTYTDYWCYYKMPAKYVVEAGQEARVGFAFNFPNATGTYEVTIKVGGVHKK